MTRFAWYGRLSTVDRQDKTLARPSQFEACQRRVVELGGEITAEFWDDETGAHFSRPELSNLLAEARREDRRFDAVICFQTSRLARVQVDALLHERELKRANCPIVYVHGGGSELEKGLSQLIDQHMRERLREETKRGMRAAVLAGRRVGGRAPYGYRLEHEPHPTPARAKAGETVSRLVVVPEQAKIVREIFKMWNRGSGTAAICDALNSRRVPSPTHVDNSRNLRGNWSKSTIKSILRNPTYTGLGVWDRLDFASKRELGAPVRQRNQDEWTVAEEAHERIVSDEVFATAQERADAKSKASGRPRKGQREHLLSGVVRCGSGHAPLSMYGSVQKAKTYYRCSYGRSYGRAAADAIEGHGLWCSVREDLLLPFVERFFSERVFGPMRLDLLREQLLAEGATIAADAEREQAQLRRKLSELDTAIERQLVAIEQGVEPKLIGERITQLRAEREQVEAALRDTTPVAPTNDDELVETLRQLPDLSERLRNADEATKRLVFDAFDLRIVFDKTNGRVRISATVYEHVGDLLGGVAQDDIAGAGLKHLPATYSESKNPGTCGAHSSIAGIRRPARRLATGPSPRLPQDQLIGVTPGSRPRRRPASPGFRSCGRRRVPPRAPQRAPGLGHREVASRKDSGDHVTRDHRRISHLRGGRWVCVHRTRGFVERPGAPPN